MKVDTVLDYPGINPIRVTVDIEDRRDDIDHSDDSQHAEIDINCDHDAIRFETADNGQTLAIIANGDNVVVELRAALEGIVEEMRKWQFGK